MNIKLDYPLERFMIWLTGNDHERSVVIDKYIAQAISDADPECKITRLEILPSGCHIVWWADKVMNGSIQELQACLLSAIQLKDFSLATKIQERIRQKL